MSLFSAKLSSVAFNDCGCLVIYAHIFQHGPQNQHIPKPWAPPPKTDVASLILFPELVRRENLTGNPGAPFLTPFPTAISFAGPLISSLQLSYLAGTPLRGQLLRLSSCVSPSHIVCVLFRHYMGSLLGLWFSFCLKENWSPWIAGSFSRW